MSNFFSKAGIVLGALVLSASASASVITFNLDASINGTSPYAADKAPWLSASFSDLGKGVVQLVLTNNLVDKNTQQATGEFVTDWLFNLDPLITSLSYTHMSGYAATVTIGQTAGKGGNIKGGVFDIDFAGATPNAQRFTGGMTSVYNLSAEGLSADSFAFKSNLGYYSAADVKGIGNGGSGSIGTKAIATEEASAPSDSVPVPEPASLMLLGAGVFAALLAGRRAPGSQPRRG